MLYKIFLPVWFCYWASLSIFCVAQEPKLVIPIGHSELIWNAQFSPDNQLILTNSDDHTAKIWNGNTGTLLYTLEGHSGSIGSAQFSPDGKLIATLSGEDHTCRLWATATGKLIKKFILKSDESEYVYELAVQFNPDGKTVLITSSDNSIQVWNINTGKKVFSYMPDLSFPAHSEGEEGANPVTSMYNPDGKKILLFSYINFAEMIDAATGKRLFTLEKKPVIRYAAFSNDGKWLITDTADIANKIKVWNAATGKLFKTISASENIYNIYSIQFNKNGKKFFIGTDSAIITYNTSAWKPVARINNEWPNYGYHDNKTSFSPDTAGKLVLAAGADGIGKIWDAATGNSLIWLDMTAGKIDIPSGINFSPDGTKIVSSFGNNNGIVWDATTGKILFTLKTPPELKINPVHSVLVSPDDKWILSVLESGIINVWETSTGKLVQSFAGYDKFLLEEGGVSWNNHPRFTQFSPDEKFIITYQNGDTAKLWETSTGKYVCSFNKNGRRVGVNDDINVLFGKNEKKISIVTGNDTAVLNIANLNLNDLPNDVERYYQELESSDRRPIREWKSADIKHYFSYDCPEGQCDAPYLGEMYAAFSHKSKWVVTVSGDNTLKLRDTATAKVVYTFFSTDSADYLALDKDSHYDGTAAARKLLYFTCGLEVISLDQVKDQLWVPNLIERINKKETINAKTLSELNVCSLTPEIKEVSGNPDEYYFTIKPRRGGLGEINLSINGIIADTRKPEQLTKKEDFYELRIIKNEFIPSLPDGQMNSIALKAWTADNKFSSREIIIDIDKTDKPKPPPNLYAVMVGVSDYKGDRIDLDYAAIDATSVSSALKDAAVKLLGKEHVFMYNLTTAKDRDEFPEKKSIKKIFEDIGKKATANDILFIFLSGHGVMGGDGKKQFYYLTADASYYDSYDSTGISTTELTEWIRPQNIKAQKRILILDACHSGQAINDVVNMGNNEQGFLAVKGDDMGEQIKAIDKLNEKSGLFVLSASASDKLAFESDRYAHGFLTYSLLKAIKEQPDILEEGKFLDVSRWFNAAAKTVGDLAKENNSTQEPQIVSTTNFNIGMVDEEVTGKIKLSGGKPLFSASNFQNSDEAADGDDQNISKQLNNALAGLSSKSAESKFVYVANTNSSEAYSLSGRYDVKGNEVTIRVVIKKNNVTSHKFEDKGTKETIKELTERIASAAADWVEKNK